jgi:hypothetical protein
MSSWPLREAGHLQLAHGDGVVEIRPERAVGHGEAQVGAAAADQAQVQALRIGRALAREALGAQDTRQPHLRVGPSVSSPPR